MFSLTPTAELLTIFEKAFVIRADKLVFIAAQFNHYLAKSPLNTASSASSQMTCILWQLKSHLLKIGLKNAGLVSQTFPTWKKENERRSFRGSQHWASSTQLSIKSNKPHGIVGQNKQNLRNSFRRGLLWKYQKNSLSAEINNYYQLHSH